MKFLVLSLRWNRKARFSRFVRKDIDKINNTLQQANDDKSRSKKSMTGIVCFVYSILALIMLSDVVC